MSIDLSLDRIRRLQAKLVPYTRPTCHITGTNGKGSVAALLSSIFQASSARTVGRFNSPHLVSIRDSITINNEPVSADVYEAARSHVEQTDAAHAIGASSFELLTCTALHIFERAQADAVVLEVGMGGRLDATNIIPDSTVLASALTAVDLDHQAFLGSSVSAIALEKAGIARPGRPFVLGKQVHAEVEPVVRRAAAQVGAEIVLAPSVVLHGNNSPAMLPPLPQSVQAQLPCFPESIRALLPLHGEHQLANLGTALGVVSALFTHCPVDRLPWLAHLTPDSISRGIQNTKWPGRLSFHQLTPSSVVLADGAHNPASAFTLAAYLKTLLPRPITFLVALSHSPPKSPLETLAPLLSLPTSYRVGLLQFSPPAGMPWVQPESLPNLRAVVSQLAPDAEIWESSAEEPIEQLRSALKWAVEGDELIVVAGSLYLVADFYRLLEENPL
ncbi:uncharacterized protein FIBRA_04558 [Fibroporia radiculosa]|uniref:Mur ligase central domain-containing protein n=1 Tax=Fibroporia radiculosa TaxID=599839 RepID=J4H310_9APHY|nr:uncharacterized protein FIBRA_04558 [Fibroporia radiculosa]CCM02459.1 predicted protein [Fibroporia radiculosa]